MNSSHNTRPNSKAHQKTGKKMKKRTKKYHPKRVYYSTPLARMYRQQRHEYKIDLMCAPMLAWLSDVISRMESPVNARGEYTIRIDKAYLPAWEGFESILDVADIATHRGIELPSVVHIEQMRNYSKAGMPISPAFASETRAELLTLSDALKGLDTGVLQSIADATLTRIYLQKSQAKAQYDQRENA